MAVGCCVSLLRAKLHRVVVTGARLDYEGSLGLSGGLMDLVGVLPFERVLCGGLSTGVRFETYVIRLGGVGEVVLNGAAARLGVVGDLLTVMCFAQVGLGDVGGWRPRVAVFSKGNSEWVLGSGSEE